MHEPCSRLCPRCEIISLNDRISESIPDFEPKPVPSLGLAVKRAAYTRD